MCGVVKRVPPSDTGRIVTTRRVSAASYFGFSERGSGKALFFVAGDIRQFFI